MLEYPLDEAEMVLQNSLGGIKSGIENTNQSLLLVREQCTICEVNIARLYNCNVQKRREANEAMGNKGSK